MKSLLTGTIIATLALTTAAFAFGRGSGPGLWSNGQQGQYQTRSSAQQAGWNQGGNRGMRFASAAQPRTPIFMDGWDGNDDGILTSAEATEQRGIWFDSLDGNEDGVLVAAEFTEFLDATRMAPQDATNGQRGLYGMTLGFNDANGDGSVTREEFLQKTNAFISAMDRNGDGQLTDDDFGTRRGAMAAGQSQRMSAGMGQRAGRGNASGSPRGMGRGQANCLF